jgi:hypothetical protein
VTATPSTRVTLTSLVTCRLHPTLAASLYTLNSQHITENIHKKFGKEYKAPFWQVARTQSQSAFDTAVQALQIASP